MDHTNQRFNTKRNRWTNEICLFMKGTPDAPQCGFSMAVSNMLKILEVNLQRNKCS